MKKSGKLLLVAVLVISFLLAGCGQTATTSKPTEEGDTEKPYEIAFIVGSLGSEFSQYNIIGAKNAEHDLRGSANVTVYGPEKDVESEEVQTIYENVVNSNPDAIVFCPKTPEGPVNIMEKAAKKGIAIVTFDQAMNSDVQAIHLATDNYEGGRQAGIAFVEKLKEMGLPLQGKVGRPSCGAVPFIDERNDGFVDALKELAPNITVLDRIYTENDLQTGMGVVEDLLTANDDMIGFYGDNNSMGDAIAAVVSERGLEDQLCCVSYDSDPQEIAALESGVLKALVVQDPYGEGYKGIFNAVMAINGVRLNAYEDTGVQTITKENMNDEDIKAYLNPMLLKRYE